MVFPIVIFFGNGFCHKQTIFIKCHPLRANINLISVKKFILKNFFNHSLYLVIILLQVLKNNLFFVIKHCTNRKEEMFYLTMHSTHFIYGYMVKDHSDNTWATLSD